MRFRIQNDVLTELMHDPYIHGSQIGVEVSNSVVTLSGKVYGWFERNSAISAAWEIPSVKNVIDKIQIVN